jgi:hypothetical protein
VPTGHPPRIGISRACGLPCEGRVESAHPSPTPVWTGPRSGDRPIPHAAIPVRHCPFSRPLQSRRAPSAFRICRNSAPSMARGCLSSRSANAAAWPTACPYAKQCAVTRAEAIASCSAERQRPAMRMFSPRRGTRQPYGTSSSSHAAPRPCASRSPRQMQFANVSCHYLELATAV